MLLLTAVKGTSGSEKRAKKGTVVYREGNALDAQFYLFVVVTYYDIMRRNPVAYSLMQWTGSSC